VALNIGDSALNFSGEDRYGNQVTLSSYLGKWRILIIFYPYDWSPISMMMITGVQKYMSALIRMQIKVIGISVDSVYSHREWARKHSIEFPLISDYMRIISNEWGVLDSKGYSRPTIFLIGKDKKIALKRSLNMGEKPSYESIIETAQELIDGKELA